MCYNVKNKDRYSGHHKIATQNVLKEQFPVLFRGAQRKKEQIYMGYTGALKDIGASYNKKGIDTRTNHNERQDGSFGKVMRETQQTENTSGTATTEEISMFTTGAAIDMLSVMSQLKVSNEADFSDELDEAIGFDEIEELDSIADSQAINYYDSKDDDVFAGFSIFPDSDEISEDDLSMFELIEEVS